MKTITEYLVNNHINVPKNLVKCFVDIDEDDPNFKNYIRFRSGSWRKIRFILKDELFKNDVNDILDALKDIFKNDANEIYVELPSGSIAIKTFETAICISLNEYSVTLKDKETQEAKELYNYFKNK